MHRAVLAVAGLTTSGLLAIAGVAAASTTPAAADVPTCTAATGLLYGGNDGTTFAVQSTPINERGIGMKAETDGLHLTLAGAGDADVIYESTTLGAIIDGGLPVKASSNIAVNLWFDTNHDGRYFDLSKAGTGTFTSLSGDDYGSVTTVNGALTVAKLGGATLPATPTKLTDLDTATKGAINRDTRVAVDAVLSGQTAGTVQSVGGVSASVCVTPAPPTTDVPAPTTSAAATTNNAGSGTSSGSGTANVGAPAGSSDSQVAVVPAGVNTGRA